MSNEQNGQSNYIEQARALLSPYLDDEVTPDERALVERALDQSTALQDELASLRQTTQMVQALPRVAAPRPFALSAADVGMATDIPNVSTPWWSWLKPFMGGAAVVAATLIVGAYLFLQFNPTPDSASSEIIALESSSVSATASIGDAAGRDQADVGEVADSLDEASADEELMDTDVTETDDTQLTTSNEKVSPSDLQADQADDSAAESSAGISEVPSLAATDTSAPEPTLTSPETIVQAQESIPQPTQRMGAAPAQVEALAAEEQAPPALSDVSAYEEAPASAAASDDGSSERSNFSAAAESVESESAPLEVAPAVPPATATLLPTPSPSLTPIPTATTTPVLQATIVAQAPEASDAAQTSDEDIVPDDSAIENVTRPQVVNTSTARSPMTQFLLGAGAATVVAGLIFAALVIIWRNKQS